MHGLLSSFDPSCFAFVSPLAVWSAIWPYLLMLLGFSFIVFVHELGHFAVAKWCGVRVEKFAIGFGREIFGFTRGETRYSFNFLPLGGYVKMLGQEDFDDKSEEWKFRDDPRSFINKPVPQRMAIVSAGVIMNIILACLLFGVVFMIGKESLSSKIGSVEPDSPAHRAGLLPGDEVVKINGDNVREFQDILYAVFLAPPHEPIEFIVNRNGKVQDPIYVVPDYRRPDATREMRRQMVGIGPGRTREIAALGSEIDKTRADHPRVGDKLIKVAGEPVDDANASQMVELLPYRGGHAVVLRSDPSDPKKEPAEVAIHVPPRLTLFPSDRMDTASATLLGMTPLARFDSVEPDGRAKLGGLRPGDTVLRWDDRDHPTKSDITRAIHESAERDIAYRVQRVDGRVESGFVRPKINARGPANIQATCVSHTTDDANGTGPKAKFSIVRPSGVADRAGVQPGDLVSRIGDTDNPTAAQVNAHIRERAGKPVRLTVKRPDGDLRALNVVPQPPGSIDAGYDVVAQDHLQVGRVVAKSNGRQTPAAAAGVPDGAQIKAVGGQVVSSWSELIEAFRDHAGRSVELTYQLRKDNPVTTSIAIPRTLHTVLGVGPEARILKIDGKAAISTPIGGADEEVLVGHYEGLRTALTGLVGQTKVPVEYRESPLGDVRTAYIDVTEDMVDPWLARVALTPTIAVNAETTILKGKNVLDAVGIGVHKTYYFILQVYSYLNRMIVSRSVSVETVSGPLGIIDMGGKVARAGGVDFLFFLAIISANLAVINFLPLPIVDGGLMVFLIIEWLKGSPVSLRVQVATQAIGLFLIVGAFLFVTYQDVVRMFG